MKWAMTPPHLLYIIENKICLKQIKKLTELLF
jgi:hypothetical protein